MTSASPDTQEWFSAMYLLKEEFNDASGLNPGADFFYYQPSDQTLVGSSRINVQSWRSGLAPLIAQQPAGLVRQTHWSLMTVESRTSAPSQCLTRIVSLQNGYLGCTIPVDDLLATLTSASTDSSYNIADADGRLLRSAPDQEQLEDFPGILGKEYSFVTLNGVKCMILARALSDTDLYLVSITQDYPRMVSATLFRAFIVILFVDGEYVPHQLGVLLLVGAVIQFHGRIYGVVFPSSIRDCEVPAFHDLILRVLRNPSRHSAGGDVEVKPDHAHELRARLDASCLVTLGPEPSQISREVVSLARPST